MSQRKVISLLESLLNVGSGFIISLALWRWIVCPYMGIAYSNSSNIAVTGLFTAVSVVRGYCWRRIFNNNRK